jgi:alkylation response protein AidB-like acyl-CoA dehydrogenase
MSGKFLLLNKDVPSFMTPEKFEDHIEEFGRTAREFLDKEVHPVAEEIQSYEGKMSLNPKLMAKAGELGLLMVEVPEAYEGMGMDLTTGLRVAEQMDEGSFGTTYMAHTGIGTLPIVFFGNEEQKKKYLPKISSGQWISAYGLTETGFGSDALGAKTKAVLSEDGKYYILNGAKQFITNSGFADLFIVYAKVDGEKFTAFLVEKTFPGISTGKEENKMGIHGSSTRPVILENCKVPVENVLGEVGQGHKSALGILDIGRIKLGVAGISGAKRVLKLATEYANNRKQFKTPIANFGMIRHKFAEIAAKTFMFESAIYRTSGMIDEDLEKIDLKDPEYSKKVGKVFKDYDVETAMMKVLGRQLTEH